MSYRLGPEESLAAGLRRSACEQLDLAVAGLADAKLDRHAAIHEARGCCKRLGGLLRLARVGRGEEACQAENAGLRDAAPRLAHLRDAEALLETYDARFTDEIDRRRSAPDATAGRRCVRRAHQGNGGTPARLPAQSAERGAG